MWWHASAKHTFDKRRAKARMRDAIRLQHLVQMTMQTSVAPNQLNMIDKMSLPSIYCRSFTLFIFASWVWSTRFFLSHTDKRQKHTRAKWNLWQKQKKSGILLSTSVQNFGFSVSCVLSGNWVKCFFLLLNEFCQCLALFAFRRAFRGGSPNKIEFYGKYKHTHTHANICRYDEKISKVLFVLYLFRLF